MRRRPLAPVAVLLLGLPALASAKPQPKVVQNPFAPGATGANVVDLSPGARNERPLLDPAYASTIQFNELDEFLGETQPPSPDPDASLPDGFAQVGGMILPEEMLDGAEMVGNVDALGNGEPPSLEGTEDCAFPDEVPPGVYEGDDKPGGETPRRGTIYLNYLGGVLSSGGENSAENISTIARTGHPYPVFTGGETKAVAVAQAVMVDFEFVQTRVVYETRPRKILPYTMVMVGGHYSDTTAGPSGGVAPLDCEDFGQRNVCYSFTNTSPAISQANIVSQEVGHTMGLAHTEGLDRIMGGGYSGASGDLIFGDNCTPIINVADQASACTGLNKCHCGDPQMQHDRNTLRHTYVPPGDDEVPPEITITAPEDGAQYEVGEEILVDVEPWDNYGGYGWKLVVKDAMTGEVMVDQVDYERVLQWRLVGVPDGTYELIGEIQDQADNITTHSIFITVGSGMGGDDTGGGTGDDTGGGSGGTDSDGSAGSDSDGSGGTDGDSDSAGMTDGDDSCSCTTNPTPTPALALGLLGLLAVRRRRDC